MNTLYNYNNFQNNGISRSTPSILGSFFSVKSEDDFKFIPNPINNGTHIIILETTKELYFKDRTGQIKKYELVVNSKDKVPNKVDVEPETSNESHSKQLKSHNMKIININKRIDKIMDKLKDKGVDSNDE
jgi:hypothetical protein